MHKHCRPLDEPAPSQFLAGTEVIGAAVAADKAKIAASVATGKTLVVHL
jgi:hypothetical protein